MLAGITSPDQEAKLIAHLKDPKSFWRQNIFPTLAADQPGYDPSGGYWLGGVWAPTNYAIIRGLARQGHGDFAREATTRYLDEMHKVFKKTGTVWELYAPDMERHGSGSAGINGEHQARPDFVGWTGCGPIAMVIENLLGFDAQGAKGELTWEITRTDRHGIRKLRFGDITASLVCAKRANPQAEAEITIQSNHPFTLHLRRNGATKSFQIEKGSTRIRF
jgi:glycogen debranching enzyme